MDKNVIGDWGAGLSDHDYGMALAALGVMEGTAAKNYPASSDPRQILAALNGEFRDGDRTVVWRGAYNITEATSESWRKMIHQEAPVLAAGWQLLLANADHPRKLPRLAVKAGWRRRPDLFDLETLLGWLGEDYTGCQALVLAPEDVRPGECRTLWHWPLNIGVPAVGEGRKLLDYLKNFHNGWIEQLGVLILMGEARDSCDLLILPTGMAAQLAEQPRLHLRASFIVCLDDPVSWSAAVDTPQARLRAKMGAAGIALVGASLDPKAWYERLMRELSHDLPVHAALWAAGRNGRSRLPVIIGEPASLDHLRILAVAEHLDRKHELLRQSLPSVSSPKKARRPKASDIYRPPDAGPMSMSYEGPEAAEEWQPAPPPPPEPLKMAKELSPPPERLSDLVRSRPFASEEADGKPAADNIAAGTAELEGKRRIRHIQAYAWREDSEAEPARALAPERPSLLTVHIGPSEKPRPDPPFPEGQIDFTCGPVGVTVQLELAGAAVAALGKNEPVKDLVHAFPQLPGGETARLFLLLDSLLAAPNPAASDQTLVSLASDDIILPVAGDSTRALFAVRPQPGAKEVRGRIAIVHQNRIVQTASLIAPVDLRGDAGKEITVAAEAVVHPRLDDLAGRRQFDAALIAADDLGSRLRLTVSHDGKSQEVYIDNLEAAIKNIQADVFATVYRTEDILPLNSPEMQKILRSFASHGRLLYDGLHRGLGDRLDASTRFQLVSRGTAFFPLEYVYDGPRLKGNAEVCPKAAEGVRRGNCDPCPHPGSKDYLCPLHFWGLSKVIERHGEVPKDQWKGSVGVDRINMPSPTRSPFGPVQPVLFAASARAFEFPDGPAWREKLLQSLSRLGGGTPPVEAKTWDDWRAAVSSPNPPKVLVLLTHSDQVLINVEALEIADQEWLLKDQIDVDVVGPNETVQLLLLLGCSAAQVRAAFAPYPFLFHDFGADIVIAPLEAILGADAVPIGKRIADLLADHLSPGQEIAFGELLRDLRRELLSDGHPGVLGLVGFGDADWVFGG